MASIDFPDSPTIGDVFIAGSGSYEWTGTVWISKNLSAIVWGDIQEKPAEVESSATLESYVDSRIELIIDAAPETLNTLNELAASLNDNADFAGTMNTALAGKADSAHTHAISDVTNLQTSLDAKKTEVVYQIAANNTLVAGARYFVDTNGARTLTLPAAPAVGDEVQIFDQTGTAATNNITIDNNGININGVNDTLIIDVDGAVAYLVYSGTALGWRI